MSEKQNTSRFHDAGFGPIRDGRGNLPSFYRDDGVRGPAAAESLSVFASFWRSVKSRLAGLLSAGPAPARPESPFHGMQIPWHSERFGAPWIERRPWYRSRR